MAELEGKKLDRYELRRLIGKGGMAHVYEAYDPNFNRVVAIKVFKRDDEEMLERFIREARVMARLHHSHLVEVYDSGEYPLDGVTRYYIVMPLLTGGTLRMRIRRQPLSLIEVCQCLRDIGGALDYIHSQGVIHRDIKASNVLLNDEGRCYLTDFGIARISHSQDTTQVTTTGNVLGTVDYVAPELFEVHQKANALSDLYSLGILLYEMVTGRLPFSADNQLALISMHISKQPPSPRQYVSHLPRGVEDVMLKALDKVPEKRYQSATKLAEAFCKAVSKSGITIPDANTSEYRPATELAPVAVTNEDREHGQGGRAYPLAGGTEGFVPRPEPLTPHVITEEVPLAANLPDLPEETKARRPRRGLVVVLVLATLLIVGSSLAYALINHSVTSNHPVMPTATISSGQTAAPGQASPSPEQSATASDSAATATAAVAPTVTAQAQATATAAPLQTATAGEPVYQDSLTDANNAATQAADWDGNTLCSFAGDGYHVQQPASFPFFKGCREQDKNFGNFTLTVNVILLSGHSGGIFFRLTTNSFGNYDGYLFEIDSQGNYKISREQGTSITSLQDWKAGQGLHSGYNVKNKLAVIANGSTFLFYANDSFLTQIQDSYDSDTATIGFLATTGSDANSSDADVVYSDLKVYALK